MMNHLLRHFLIFIGLGLSTIASSQTYSTSDNTTHTVCTGNILDPGGPSPGGFYGNNEAGFVTICPDGPGCVTLTFEELGLGNGDVITINDGSILGSTLLVLNSADPMPIDPIVGSDPSGCITVQFTSDLVGIGIGFDISFDCGACATCTDGVQNGQETGVDCGGAICGPCPCEDITIAGLPFSDPLGNTAFGADNFGFQDACGSFYMEGNEFLYAYTAAQDECLQIDLSGFPMGSAGLFLLDGCPDDPNTNCLDSYEALGFQDSFSAIYNITAGETVYFVVSSASFISQTIDYQFSLSTDCPPIDDHDCLGAVPVCDLVWNQAQVNFGAGVVPDDIDDFTTCMNQGETNSQWFQINVGGDGDLAFDIQGMGGENYDWVLYDISTFGCDGIGDFPNMVVSCNSHSDLFFNFGTGISGLFGGTGTSNGPGSVNGPPYNDLLPVNAGETYALYISAVGGGTTGFTLDFSESSADIVDTADPEVVSVTANCAGVFTVTFSEAVDCAAINIADWTVAGPGGPFVVDSTNLQCGFQNPTVSTFDFFLDNPIPASGGTYTVDYIGGITDGCGNVGPASSFDIDILPSVSFEANIVPSDCGFTNGQISLVNITGATPYQFVFNGIPNGTPNWTGLAEGDYFVTVIDNDGCVFDSTLSVGLNLQDFSAGEDTVVCALNYNLDGILPAGFAGEWTTNAALQFTDATLPNANVSGANIGVYELFWSIDNGGGCFRSDTLRITLTDPQLQVQATRESCPDDCDGMAQANFFGSFTADPFDYQFSDGSPTADPNTYGEYCPGDYSVTVTNGDGCTLTEPFTILPPIPFELDSVIGVDETCFLDCDGYIEVQDVFAVSFSYDSGNTFESSPTSPDYCSGTYSVIARNIAGCEDTAFAVVSSPVPPIADFTVSPEVNTLFTPFFSVRNNSFLNASNNWEIGEFNLVATSTEEEPNFLLDNAEIGLYQIQLIVTDSMGCMDTAYSEIEIINDFNIWAPNAFSPDDDGVNDVWKPMTSDIRQEDYLLEIFDRNGRLVWETRDMNLPWNGADGRNPNYYVEDGVYVWRISGSLISTFDKREVYGTVTIVR